MGQFYNILIKDSKSYAITNFMAQITINAVCKYKVYFYDMISLLSTASSNHISLDFITLLSYTVTLSINNIYTVNIT
jgi:phage-related protein